MKVLMINGSPRAGGNTSIALAEMEKVFAEEGIETETIQIGAQAIRGCIACSSCAKLGRCVFDDAVNQAAPKFEAADGLVVASPVYYASANGTLISFLDRLFYSTHFDKTMKVGASVVVARRGGLSATFDELNKYFTIAGMPVASSRRGPADHAGTGPEHGFPHQEHRPWQGKVRPARQGSPPADELYPLKLLGGTHFCAQSRDRNSFPLISPWGQNLPLNHALGLAASHTLSAKFPWLCPVHPHMSAGRDFLTV